MDKSLFLGIFPGDEGQRTDVPKQGNTGALLVSARVMSRGLPVTRLTLQTWRELRAEHLERPLWVMAGRLIDRSLKRALRLPAETSVLITDAAGQVVSAPQQGWAAVKNFPKRVVELSDGRAKVGGRVTLAVSDQRLRRTLKLINRVAIGSLVAALALALLFGGLARRIAGPLDGLAKHVEALSLGQTQRPLTVRGRDEVSALLGSFNRMTERLQESTERLRAAERVAAWQDIAQRIAHEIKNPLFPIQTSIETLQKVQAKGHPAFEEIFAESTGVILEEVGRLKRYR